MLVDEISELGEKLKYQLKLNIGLLDKDSSRFFKSVFMNTPRIIRKR